PGPQLLRVEVLSDRRIRLHIRSVAMRREIAIDTLVGTGPAPRPTPYLLDGVDGGPTSGWLTDGGAAEFSAARPGEVLPTPGAAAHALPAGRGGRWSHLGLADRRRCRGILRRQTRRCRAHHRRNREFVRGLDPGGRRPGPESVGNFSHRGAPADRREIPGVQR